MYCSIEEPSNDSNDDDDESKIEKYKAICDFTSQDPGQVTFTEGAIMIIIDKDDDGMYMYYNNRRLGQYRHYDTE